MGAMLVGAGACTHGFISSNITSLVDIKPAVRSGEDNNVVVGFLVAVTCGLSFG